MVTLDEQKTTEHSNRPPADADADADAADGYFNEADSHLHQHNSHAKLNISLLPQSKAVGGV